MDSKTASHIQQQILNWFDQQGRKNLPWQKTISCYRVWISEIMLQQTQVKTVIPYYLNFMQHFPTVSALAQASVDEVLHAWTGLGYYARARNLHKAANIILEKYHGEFPQQFEDIVQLPGIGRSTAGAICAIALQQHYPILDGNVKRVLTRFAAIEGSPQIPTVGQKLWQLAGQLTPVKRVADYTQAIMDIGALICTRTKPQCEQCPLKTDCRAYHTQTQTLYPMPKTAKILPIKKTIMLIIKNTHGEILLEKRPPIGIWGGLWSLPQCAVLADIPAWLQKQQISVRKQTSLPSFRHTFSHYHLDIEPVLLTVKNNPAMIRATDHFIWYSSDLKLGLAAPVKKLLRSFG